MNSLLRPTAVLYLFLAGLTTLLCLTLAAPSAQAQERGGQLPRTSPNAAVTQAVGVAEVRITYGRPSVRGRVVFGELVPYGEVWRAGANEATTITFSDDAEIEGQPLAAGTYGLFTVPGEEAWTVVFNRQREQWGAFNYEEGQDALRVEVTPEEAPPHEMLTFIFEEVTDTSAVAALYWEEVRVPFAVAFDTPALIREKATAALETAEDWQGPHQYAAYALSEGLYLDDALRWAERSIEIEETFQNTALKARLLAAQERYDEAAEAGAQALSLAETMDEAPNGMEELESMMAEWEAGQ